MRFLKKLILFTLLVLFAGAAVVGGRLIWQGYQIYKQVTGEESLSEKVAEIRANPHYTTLDELPQTYKDAVVAVEDSRFYKHGGLDLISTGRAVVINLREGELAEGGSTITQQLAKNMYFTQEKKFLRKVAELFVAFDLERDYTKDEILELYLNTIYFGSGYYCVYDAAEGYFGKEPSQMTDYESTLLAGIPNAPSVYSLTNSPELAAQRQKTVLECMVQQDYITQEQADEILAEGKFCRTERFSRRERNKIEMKEILQNEQILLQKLTAALQKRTLTGNEAPSPEKRNRTEPRW